MTGRGFENIAFCNYADSTGGSSTGSQGDNVPSYLSLEEEARTTQILTWLDREWSWAQIDREWEAILSSSSSDDTDSSASTVDTKDERDATLRRASIFRRWVMAKETLLKVFFFSFLDTGDGREPLNNAWPLPPKSMGEASAFRNQVREYLQRLDSLRDSVMATNEDGEDNSITEWLNNLAGFRSIFVEARDNAGFLAVDFQAATQYLNNIH